MTRHASLAFLAVTLTSVPAFACAPVSDGAVFPLFAALVAIPATLAASMILGVFARRWSLSFWGWFRTSVASFGAAALGGGAGVGIALLLGDVVSNDAALTISATTPLLTTIGYVLWIRSRRHIRGATNEVA